MDNRISVLASNILNYSIQLNKGEKVLISYSGNAPVRLVKVLIRKIYEMGGYPFVEIKSNVIDREIIMAGHEGIFNTMADIDCYKMNQMDAYIGIRAEENLLELSDVPDEKHKLYSKLYVQPVHYEIRVKKTKWVVLRYPSYANAQAAGMSFDAFEDFYFNVCNLDYKKMDAAMEPLKMLMEQTDYVKILGKNTNISFSIANMPVIKCAGDRNIPDGEIFTAPIKDSVNGVIAYNAPSRYDGFTFENVTLKFENGKIVACSANDTDKLTSILDSDSGARYIGEFAIGVNPYITKPVGDILFDEKISGSFHFTPGNCYEECDNKNKSSIHWDLVFMETEKFGAAEIYFDDILIRKNGRFVLPALLGLNPENLI